MISNWFRSKAALSADLDLHRTMLADRDETVVYLNEVMAQGAATGGARIAALQKSLDHALYTAGFERSLRNEAEFRLGAVVAELHKLREEIREAEGIDDVIAQETQMKRRLDV